MRTRSPLTALFLLVALLPTTGCLFRSRRVEHRATTAPLKTATQQELVAQVNAEAASIETLNATVDIATSIGGEKKGKVTDYKEIRGYLLVRKPMLRMIGLLPIVRNRAFDMVSNGQTFKLWIPPKNKFYVGSNNVSAPSPNPMENIRPQVIYDALLLRPIDLHADIAVLEASSEPTSDAKTHKEIEEPTYVLDVIHNDGHHWALQRKVIFSRTTLRPHRQIIYDGNGSIATDVHYGEFKDYGVPFPSVIQIWRPEEEYAITIAMVKVAVNQPLTDEQFALNQPPGAQLVQLDRNVRASDGGK